MKYFQILFNIYLTNNMSTKQYIMYAIQYYKCIEKKIMKRTCPFFSLYK